MQNIIQKFLSARQSLILDIEQFISSRPFIRNDAITHEKLNSLCENLVDYLSFCHFSFLEHVESFLGRDLICLLVNNTQKALDFNDRYQENYPIGTLEQDLSHLFGLLADRFDWEDSLIHSWQKASWKGKAA